MKASSLEPGRTILIAPKKTLGKVLRKARLLQKVKDQGALQTLIKLFAGQVAVVIEPPSIYQVEATEQMDGMCRIRTSAGTTASLPIGAIGPEPNAERKLVSCIGELR